MAGTTKNTTTTIKELARLLPKTELHLHLDGSLSSEFIFKRAEARNIKLDVTNPEELRPHLQQRKIKQIAGGNKQSAKGNWSIFDFCNRFLQTKEELIDATADILYRCSRENVKVCEIRFCPSLHTLEGLTEKDAIKSVIDGYAKAQEKVNIEGGVIVCALRSYPTEHSVEMAQLASEFLDRTPGVVGYDIAGDEGSYPLSLMMDGIKEAKRLNVPVTVHAGEWPIEERFKSSIDNLDIAVNSDCIKRIGHGIQLYKRDDLMKKVIDNNIFVECCLTSNVGWKVKTYNEHPIKIMHENGIKCSLNSDNFLLSGDSEREPSPTIEVLHLLQDVQLSIDDLSKILCAGAESCLPFTFHSRPMEGKRFYDNFKNEVEDIINKYDQRSKA